jgi:hypothetical protein
MRAPMKKTWKAAGEAILGAFLLRWLVPDSVLIPWGWPLGSYWAQANRVAFSVFLAAGVAIAAWAALEALMEALRNHSRPEE